LRVLLMKSTSSRLVIVTVGFVGSIAFLHRESLEECSRRQTPLKHRVEHSSRLVSNLFGKRIIGDLRLNLQEVLAN
jgi:hypothetical protein